jgi:urea-proton symporter
MHRVTNINASNPMLAGNVVALLAPAIIIPIFTYGLGPDNYNWESMKAIKKADDSDLASAAHMDLESIPGERRASVDETEAEERMLIKAGKTARYLTLFLTVALLILWPMPMYGSGYVFSKPFFRGWVVVGILWLICSAMAVCVYPLYESRSTMVRTFKSIVADLSGKKKLSRTIATEGESPLEKDGASTPVEKVSEVPISKE